MKRTLNKLMALLCTLAITMSWLPAIPVMAAETVKEIGSETTILKEGNVKLTGPVSLKGTQTLSNNLTIDLAGYTLTGDTAPFFEISGNYVLTITDSSATDTWKTNGTGKVQGIPGAATAMVRMQGVGTFNLQGGTMTGNASAGMGGALRMNNGSEKKAVFNMSGGVITNNTCAGTGQGSAVMVYDNTMTMTGGKIYGNSSNEAGTSRNGAAVYTQPSGTFKMSGGEIYGNTNSTDSTYSADIHSRGTLAISGGIVGSDDVKEEAVYVYSGTTTISGSAQIKGKGVVRNNGTITVGALDEGASISAPAALTVNGDNVVTCTVGSGYRYICSAGTYALTADTALTGTVTVSGDLTIDLAGHTLSGAVAPYFVIPAGKKLTIQDSAETGTGTVLGFGEGSAHELFNVSGAMILDGGTITGHKSTEGWARGFVVEVCSGGSFTMNGGAITNCQATNGTRGVVGLNGATSFIMNGGQISGNYTNVYGTVVATPTDMSADTKATFTMTGGEISGNYAKEGAGVAYLEYTDVTITGGTIEGNAAYKESTLTSNRTVQIYLGTGCSLAMSGGAIGNSAASVTACGVEYAGATVHYGVTTTGAAAFSGTAKVATDGVNDSGGKATVSNLAEGAEIYARQRLGILAMNNVAEAPVTGGYVYTYGTPNLFGTVTASKITSGEYVLSDDVTLSGTVEVSGKLAIDLNGKTLTGNALPYFQVNAGGTLTITDSKATNKWKTDGGGTIKGRTTTAAYYNGVVYVNGGVFNLEGGTMQDAAQGKKEDGTYYAGNAGAVRVSAGEFNMNGGLITRNTMSNGGGVLISKGATMNMRGGTITGNATSSADGGAIWLDTETATLNIHDGEIYGNTSARSGHNIHNNGKVNVYGGVIGKDDDKDAIQQNSTASVLNITKDAVIGGKNGVVGTSGTATIHDLTEKAGVKSSVSLPVGAGTVAVGQVNGYYMYAGDAIRLSGNVDTTKTFSGAFVLDGDVVLSGKYALTGNLTVDLAGHTITGTTTPFFEVPAGKTLTIKDSSGTNAGKLNAAGISVGNSNGIVFANGGTFELEGGTLTGRVAAVGYNGGAVDVRQNGHFIMSGGEISGNTAMTGTAVIISKGAMTMSGGSIINNTGEPTRSGHGAIYISAGTTFTMSGGTIAGNTNLGNGDNIHNRGTFIMTGGTLGDADDADALYGLGGTVTISGTAQILGGGIKNTSGTIKNLENGAYVVSAKALTRGDNSVKETRSGESYIYTWLDPDDVANTLSGEVRTEHLAVAQEYTLTGSVTFKEKVVLSEGKYVIDLKGNAVYGDVLPYLQVKAGATLTIKDTKGGGTINGRTLTENYYCGMVYVNGGVFNLEGGTMQGAALGKKEDGTYYAGNAGAVRVSSGTFNMSGGLITRNTMSNGGGVLISNGATMNMYGGTITGNATATADGGAIWVDKGSAVLNIYGGEIYGNTAARNGQNIHNRGTVNVYGGTIGDWGDQDAIYQNSADGMGVLNVRGSAVIQGGGIVHEFDKVRLGALENGAEVSSAGRLDVGSDITVSELNGGEGPYLYTFSGNALNTAPVSGAVVLAADTTFTPGTVYYLTSDVTLNSKVTLAEGEYTIYLDGYTLAAPEAPYFTVPAGAKLTVCDRTNNFGQILGRTDSKAGWNGMIHLTGGTFELTGGTLTGNFSSRHNCGAVRVEPGTFDMTGGLITGNRAGSASAVMIAGEGVMNMSGGTITGNICNASQAKDTGYGAIYVSAEATLNMTGGAIYGNTGRTDHSVNIHNRGIIHISGGIVGASADLDGVYIYQDENSNGVLEITGNPVIAGGGVVGTLAEVTIGSLTYGAEVFAKGELVAAEGDTSVVKESLAGGMFHYMNVKPLRVLSIGNSFSRDSFFYLSYLADLVGAPIEAAYLEKGSATLREHANLLASNTKASNKEGDAGVVYSYWKTNMDRTSPGFGGLVSSGKANVPYALADGAWDVVMLHQGTTSVGFPGTYNADLEYLADFIEANEPGAKLYWNMTWAYAENDPTYGLHVPINDKENKVDLLAGSRYHAFNTYYNGDQATMYNAIVARLGEFIVGEKALYGDRFDGWFPVGAALQNLRGTSYGDRVTRDGYHLALGGGRLTAAMTVLQVLRPEVELDSITLEGIEPFLRITNDGVLSGDGHTDTNGKQINQERLTQIIEAVKSATTQDVLRNGPAKLEVAAAETIEVVTNGDHSTVAQAAAPLKLHFPDVARLADGTVVVSAYENVAHTPLLNRTVDNDTAKTIGNFRYYEKYNGFGSEGAGRLVIWTGDETGSNWKYDEPLLVIDQKQLHDWGVVELFGRYGRIGDESPEESQYLSYSDPRDPNLTVAYFDADGDGDKDEVLLLTFWLCSVKGYIGTDNDGNPKGAIKYSPTYMTWSVNGGQWQKPVVVSEHNKDGTFKTTLKRGDIAVFDNGQILVPTYVSGTIQANLVEWTDGTWKWVSKADITDFAPDETEAYKQYGASTEFNEMSLVAPDPSGDVVYGFIRNNGIVIKSENRGADWKLVGNEAGGDYTSRDGYIHQPGFALIDTNRVFATWARIEYPRNTIGKVFEVNDPAGWDATTAQVIYPANGYGNTGSRDTGDPSAELLLDGKTVLVVSYDTAYRSIVGSKVTIEQEITSLPGTVSADSRYTLTADTSLSRDVTVNGYLTIDLAGHKLSSKTITVQNGGTLAIVDSSAGQTGQLASTVVNNGLFTVAGGYVSGTVNGSGTRILTGGTYAVEPDSAWLSHNGPYVIRQAGSVWQVVRGLDCNGGIIDFGSSLNVSLPLAGENGVGMNGGYTVTLSNNKYNAEMGSKKLAEGVDPVSTVMVKGIAAKEMRDEITVTVTKGDVVYYTDTLSVYELVNGWYGDAENPLDKTMLLDVLNYGAAASNEFLGTEFVLSDSETKPNWVSTPNCGVSDKDYADMVAYTLSLKDKITLNVYINANLPKENISQVTADKVSYLTNGKSTITRVTFDDINVVDALKPVSFKVTLSDSESFDVTYSIKDYVVQALNGGQKAVVQALQKYVDSVVRVLGN